MAKKTHFYVTIINKVISDDQFESNVEREFRAESREAMETILATFALQNWKLMPLGSKMSSKPMKLVNDFFGTNRTFSYYAKEYEIITDDDADKGFNAAKKQLKALAHIRQRRAPSHAS
jgi:hypothetical protein